MSGGGDGDDAAGGATVLDICSGRTDHINLEQAVSSSELRACKGCHNAIAGNS